MQDILIVVDMQNDFIDGALGTKEAAAIVPKVKEKISSFRGPGDIHPGHPSRKLYGDPGGQKSPGAPLHPGHRRLADRPELDALRKTQPVDKPGFGSVELGKLLLEMNGKRARRLRHPHRALHRRVRHLQRPDNQSHPAGSTGKGGRPPAAPASARKP